jgi:D-alanyl-D-alanine carboxypeptidase/D-alanyl-D-alanine-endopeptidase (penicillin-binding protein 4)
MWDEESESYNMMISPLSVNSNSITIQARPGKLENAPVRVRTVPATAYVSIENTATTPVDTPIVPLVIARKWRERSNTITIMGQLLRRDSLSERYLSIWQPERYTLTLLAERLQSYGFLVKGITLDTVGSSALPLAEFSHRLDSVILYMNKVSDNISAENILKTLSAERTGKSGTAKSGVSLIQGYLSSIGIDTTKLTMVDGSGLSRYNLTSPNIIIRLLTDMYTRDSLFETFYTSLPIAGKDGTLSERMKGTSAEGNLRAKTGTLSGVTALSGYVKSADGEMFAFSILMNNYPTGARMYRRVQDRIGVILSQISRGSL